MEDASRQAVAEEDSHQVAEEEKHSPQAEGVDFQDNSFQAQDQGVHPTMEVRRMIASNQAPNLVGVPSIQVQRVDTQVVEVVVVAERLPMALLVSTCQYSYGMEYPWCHGCDCLLRLLPRLILDTCCWLTISDSTASTANFGHEILIFFVEVGWIVGKPALSSLGSQIDFTIFGEMTSLSTTMTDDIGAKSTHLRTIIFTMSDFTTYC